MKIIKKTGMFLLVLLFILSVLIIGNYVLFSKTGHNKSLTTDVSNAGSRYSFDNASENFKNCVVNAYNESKTEEMPSASSVDEIESFDLIKNISCMSRQISDVSGIENLTNLTSLDLTSNRLKSINLSNNTKLKTLRLSNNFLTSIDLSNNQGITTIIINNNKLNEIDISFLKKISSSIIGNPYQITQYIYLGETNTVANPIKVPQSIEKKYHYSETPLATINSDEKTITGIQEGKADIIGRTAAGEEYTLHLNVIKLTSDIYKINEDNNTIYIGTDTSNQEIINKLKISNNIITDNNFTIELNEQTNKLIFKYKNELLKEIDVLRINTGNYKEANKKIEIGTSTISVDKFIKDIIKVGDEGLTFKVYKNNQEVTSGNIAQGMQLRVLLRNEVIDKYDLLEELPKDDEEIAIVDENTANNKPLIISIIGGIILIIGISIIVIINYQRIKKSSKK